MQFSKESEEKKDLPGNIRLISQLQVFVSEVKNIVLNILHKGKKYL